MCEVIKQDVRCLGINVGSIVMIKQFTSLPYGFDADKQLAFKAGSTHKVVALDHSGDKVIGAVLEGLKGLVWNSNEIILIGDTSNV